MRLFLATILWLGCSLSAALADNNLVTTLIDVPEAREQPYPFTNPRDGWVFVARGTAESMNWMKSGKHEVNGSAGERLLIRSIPEIVYSELGYRPSPFLQGYPRYDVAYLEKIGVFRNVNVVLELQPEPWFDHEKWKASGRQIRVRVGCQEAKPEETYQFWANHRGMRDPYDGIQISEYDGWKGSPHLPTYRFLADAARKISEDPKFQGKKIVPYTVAMYDSVESMEFLKTLFSNGHIQACERYIPEAPSLEWAGKELHWMSSIIDQYRRLLPGSERNSILALGYMSAPHETLDNCPDVNYLVFMDMQMKAVVTDPAYKGLYGLEWYHSAYADEEVLRWSVKLLRHYCIEGKRELLSQDPYLLTHLKNGDFAEGTNGWTLEPAGPDTMTTKSHEGLSYLQTRFPHVEQGKTFLWTRRSADKPNIFKQTIRSLEPGKLYSLRMMVCDYQDLIQAKDNRQEHKPLVRIEGVEMHPASFREVFASGAAGHVFEKFNQNNNLWVTYHRLIFRAKSETAELIISDWELPDKPGGPAGQESAFNYISVQPYLEP